ncbi:MAG: DUF1801 domain-containing protein [Bacteroidia bacterium]
MAAKGNKVEEYILRQPKELQKRLEQLRALILKAVPDAAEEFSYGMPAYKLNGKPLVYFACFAQHTGLYATPAAHTAFAKELAIYKQGKGSVQFPHGSALPLTLIKKIVLFKAEEVRAKTAPAKKKIVCPNGHTFYKSSDCRTCPKCEAAASQSLKAADDFLSHFAAPARRALQSAGITTLAKLSKTKPNDLQNLHGIGPNAMKVIQRLLKEKK